MKRILSLIGGAGALALLLVATGPRATAQDEAPAEGAATGHCDFTMQNAFAGPYKSCSAPVTAERCATIGKTDDNSNAAWSEGDCASDGAVGTCTVDGEAVTYYEGEASGLEIGCGFMGGDWK